MHKTHGLNPIILFLNLRDGRRINLARPKHMETRERVISVSLNEAEWQAFIRLHPQPVVWLRERIQEALRPGPADRAVIAAAPAAIAAASTTSATTR